MTALANPTISKANNTEMYALTWSAKNEGLVIDQVLNCIKFGDKHWTLDLVRQLLLIPRRG